MSIYSFFHNVLKSTQSLHFYSYRFFILFIRYFQIRLLQICKWERVKQQLLHKCYDHYMKTNQAYARIITWRNILTFCQMQTLYDASAADAIMF